MSQGIGVLYGRMNPFTIGHQAIVNHIRSIGLIPVIIVSHTQNANKNPLSPGAKIKFIQESLQNGTINVRATSKKTSLPNILANIGKKYPGMETKQVFLGENRMFNQKNKTKLGSLATMITK